MCCHVVIFLSQCFDTHHRHHPGHRNKTQRLSSGGGALLCAVVIAQLWIQPELQAQSRPTCILRLSQNEATQNQMTWKGLAARGEEEEEEQEYNL